VVDAQSPILAPPRVVLDRPSIARVYDYLLGGTANWAIDRDFVRRALRRFPLLRDVAMANRMFVNRVVRYLARRGVRQFLDIGAGIPAWDNTHQIADEVARGCRVVYADHEPVAVAHAEVLLDKEGDPDRHAIINADLRCPDELWREAVATGLIDPAAPVAVLMAAVLHVHQPGPGGDDVGAESVARFRDLVPNGSYLAISHITNEGIPPEFVPKIMDLKHLYDEMCSSDVIWRTRWEIDALLGDFAPVHPGMVWTPQWRPEEARPSAQHPLRFASPNQAVIWAGVGQKT
jgi:S-adenosyl methyltransferase